MNTPANRDTSISASAPGKVLLTGEYAVLHGAPAIAVAVNRRARVTLVPRHTGGWTFRALGFDAAPVTLELATLLQGPAPPATSPAALAAAVMRAAPANVEWPAHLQVTIDTRALYDPAGNKLGLGSSAAACTALAGAMGALAGHLFTLADIVDIHRGYQGGRGSGFDVATAVSGGCIEYRLLQGPSVRAHGIDPGAHLAFFWTGTSASTTDRLARLESSQRTGVAAALADLADAAAGVAAEPAFGASLAPVRRFVEALRRLDRKAAIGIYNGTTGASEPVGTHGALHALAKGRPIVYKPCGAGGGDLGMAVSRDRAALSAFSDAVLDTPARPIALETDPNGLIVQRR